MVHNSIINLFLTSVLLLAGSAVFAQTTQNATQFMVGVYPKAQVGKICVAVEKKPNTVVTVELLAPTGDDLYLAHPPKKLAKFHQVFDLNELPDGIYTIRVSQGESVIVKTLQLQTPAPEVTLPARQLTVGN